MLGFARYQTGQIVLSSLFLSFIGCKSNDRPAENEGIATSNYVDAQINLDWTEQKQKQIKSNVLEQLQTVTIGPGSFDMGCASSDSLCFDSERPGHRVDITTALNVMRVEVTQRLYETVTGKNPSLFDGCGLDCPVERVSWFDAIAFANALSLTLDLDPCYMYFEGQVVWADPKCDGWRLPTEAEWEFLAKAPDSSSAPSKTTKPDVAWYSENSRGQTHPVGSKQPNPAGLYDMTGNVWEWTWDWYGEHVGHSARDPRGPKTGAQRVIKGGCWMSTDRNVRATVRDAIEPEFGAGILGLRLVQVVK